jgi:hypothetical protein
MNTKEGAPASLQGRELQEAAPEPSLKQVALAMLLVADFYCKQLTRSFFFTNPNANTT